MRTALSAAQHHTHCQQRTEELNEQIAEIEHKLSEEKRASEESTKREAERRNAEEARHQEEVQQLKKSNAELKQQLESIFVVTK